MMMAEIEDSITGADLVEKNDQVMIDKKENPVDLMLKNGKKYLCQIVKTIDPEIEEVVLVNPVTKIEEEKDDMVEIEVEIEAETDLEEIEEEIDMEGIEAIDMEEIEEEIDHMEQIDLAETEEIDMEGIEEIDLVGKEDLLGVTEIEMETEMLQDKDHHLILHQGQKSPNKTLILTQH